MNNGRFNAHGMFFIVLFFASAADSSPITYECHLRSDSPEKENLRITAIWDAETNEFSANLPHVDSIHAKLHATFGSGSDDLGGGVPITAVVEGGRTFDKVGILFNPKNPGRLLYWLDISSSSHIENAPSHELICRPLTGTPSPSSISKGTEINVSEGDMAIVEFMGIDVPNQILAPLIVAVFIAVAGFGWTCAKARFRKKINSAPRLYVAELDKLIKTGVAEGKEKAIVNARAIVAARNGLRDSMVTIATSLNSEIDRLALDIGESRGLWGRFAATNPEDLRQGDSRLNPSETSSEEEMQAAAWETIQVIGRVWPTKKVQVEVEIRKVLAELDL